MVKKCRNMIFMLVGLVCVATIGTDVWANDCDLCPENHVCANGEVFSCSQLTAGQFENADCGTRDSGLCWRECAMQPNAYKMVGRDFNGATDTCMAEICNTGFAPQDGKCVPCPMGMVCNADDRAPWSCADKTNGEYPLSNVGSDDIGDCYKTCDVHDIVYGVAYPVYETRNSPEICTFTCISITGNPGQVVGDKCVETSCNYNFEMINGVCEPCNRPFAVEYSKNGNCVVTSCNTGYHPNGQYCEIDTIGCVAPNAAVAHRTWDIGANAYGECIITQCDNEYHLAQNACHSDTETCEIPNGIGVRQWDYNTNRWGECVATHCDPGFTTNRGLTNEYWEQCGRCNNMYGINGEVAVQSYRTECEIESCIYSGEKYILANNECVFICPTISAGNDATGTQHWDNSAEKCVRTCNMGYVKWDGK